jgi:hypothetical protein
MDLIGTNPHNESDIYITNLELFNRSAPAYKNEILECVAHAKFLIYVFDHINTHRPFKQHHIRTINRNVRAIANLMNDMDDPLGTIAMFNRNLDRVSRIICLYHRPHSKFSNTKK